MRIWAAHAIFAVILIGSLAVRERAADAPPDSARLEPAILRVASAHGWRLREYQATSGAVPQTLVFDAAACSLPLRVTLRLATFEEEAMMQSAPEPGYTRRYVYFDQVWAAPNRVAAFAQRIKYATLELFGLTDYVPSWYLLQVEAPANCSGAADIDWRPVWNREFLAGARDRVEAAPKLPIQGPASGSPRSEIASDAPRDLALGAR